MKVAEEYLLALRVLGYTDCEARFLYLAATHSGYFVPRDSRETKRLYVGWLTGEVSEDALPRQLTGTLGPRCVAFSQRLVSRGQATAQGNGRQW
jgi:hypothetical protein